MKKLVMVLMLVVSAIAVSQWTMPRQVFIALADSSNCEFDFSCSPYDNVTFECWITTRPELKMDQNSYDAGYVTDEAFLSLGISAIYFNLGNFPDGGGWAANEDLYVVIKHDKFPYDDKHHEGCLTYLIPLGTESDPIFIGFDKYFGVGNGGMPVSTSSVVLNNTSATKTFVYPCVTTTGTDYNFVGLPVETGWTKGSDFDPTGENIETVSRFDAAAQMAETGVYSSVFGWCKDIPVQTGGVYSISAKNNFDFTVIGDSVNVVNNLIVTSETDYNHIVHPLTKAGLTTSAMLGNDIGIANCNAISKWNAETQAFTTSNYVLTQWMNSFSISTGQPLLVNMKTNYTWPTVKVYDGDIIEDESNISEKNAKGGTAKARLVFFHLVNDSGSELTEEEMKLIQFDAYITSRPTDVLTENGYDCGFMKIGGHSVAYVNLANFAGIWMPGDVLNFTLTNFNPGEGYELSLTIDNSSSTIYKGFEPIIAGSGTPGYLDMSGVNPLWTPDVVSSIQDSIITLNWGFIPDASGYNIYASDEPYGTFSYVTTTSDISWSTSASENKKFFYVVSTNAKSSVPPKTIEVKEKK